MTLQMNLKKLKSQIVKDKYLSDALRTFSKKDCIYLPSTGNLGDGLIQLGTFGILKELDIQLAPSPHAESALSGKKHAILGGGGGWYAGIWESHARQLRGFLDQGGELLILPSTFFGFERFFEQYGKQCVVFAREKQSFDALSTVTALKGRVYLSHDLAFAADQDHFQKFREISGKETAQFFRADAESRGKKAAAGNLDLAAFWNGDKWHSEEQCLEALLPAAQFISQYDKVHTDRLHMSVLSVMLGKNVHMYENSYFKNKAVYQHSLQDFDKLQFSESNDALLQPALYDELKEQAALRREWFEPELIRLNRLLDEKNQQLQDNELVVQANKREITHLSRSNSAQREQMLELSEQLNQAHQSGQKFNTFHNANNAKHSEKQRNFYYFSQKINQTRSYRVTGLYSVATLYWEILQQPVFAGMRQYMLNLYRKFRR